MKYILVSGGVISGIGKGVIGSSSRSHSTAPVTATRLDCMLTYVLLARVCAASSTGLLLKTLGYNVTAIKIDPYMNIDAGTMSPTEHGKLHSFGIESCGMQPSS